MSTSERSHQLLDLSVAGMTCASCVRRVERALKQVPGVEDATVNLATESARVVATAAPDMLVRLRRAVRTAGYESRDASNQVALDSTSPWTGFFPVAIGLVLCVPLLMPMLANLLGLHWLLPAWVQLLLTAPVQFWLGARFYRAGWHAARAGTGNMDLLVALGTSAAYDLSVYLLWRHADHGMPHLARGILGPVHEGSWGEQFGHTPQNSNSPHWLQSTGRGGGVAGLRAHRTRL